MSKPYAEVIGDPIAHSKSPLIHGFWLDQLGIDADYRRCHVRPDELSGYFAQRREDPDWRGCNVTIPHKEKVAASIDELDGSAAAVGAVNTVFRKDGRLVGTNTDVAGIKEALAGLALEGRTVLVLGAGGAARAAFSALASEDGATVHVMARRPDAAVEVARACGLDVQASPFAAGSGLLREAALLINATQLGMAGQEPMLGFILDEMHEMASDALVFDMVYAPLETSLLAAARLANLRTSDGLVMLVGQAAVAFGKFFGQTAPRAHDAELRRILTS